MKVRFKAVSTKYFNSRCFHEHHTITGATLCARRHHFFGIACIEYDPLPNLKYIREISGKMLWTRQEVKV